MPGASASRAIKEPLWTVDVQTHDAVPSGDAITLWSGLTCELRTVDARTGATRSSVAGPKDVWGACTCNLSAEALGCFRNRGVSVHDPRTGASRFFHPSKDGSSHWAFEAGVGVLIDATKLTGIDPKTGVDLWSASLPARGRILASHAGSTLVVYGRSGGSGVIAFEPHGGKVLWKNEYAAPETQIAPLDDRTFVVGGATVQIVDRDTGATLGAPFPNPAAASTSNRFVLSVTPSGTDLVFDWFAGRQSEAITTLVAVDRAGHERWRRQLPGSGRVVAAGSGRLVAQLDQQEVLALDAATGEVAWSWFSAAHQFHVPTPGLLLVTDGDDTIALDLTADLPQNELTVQGHVDVVDGQPHAVRVRAGVVSTTPDAQGNFSLHLRGRGRVNVRVDVDAPASSAALPKGTKPMCTVGSFVALDLAKAPSGPIALSVHDEPCSERMF